MSSIKTPNSKFNLINDRIKYGLDGGINVSSGMLLVNPATMKVGINKLNPNSTLDISGNSECSISRSDNSVIGISSIDGVFDSNNITSQFNKCVIAGSRAGTLTLCSSTDRNRQLLLGYNTTNNYSEIQSVQQGIALRNIVMQISGGNVGIGKNPGVQLDLSTDDARKLTTSTWQTGSDERVKENIEDANLDICYDTINKLSLKRFKWKDQFYPNISDRNSVGFIAQEVETIFPKSVNKVKETFLTNKLLTPCNQELISSINKEGEIITDIKGYVLKKDGNNYKDTSGNNIYKDISGNLFIEENTYETIEDFRSIDVDQLNKTLFGAVKKLINKVTELEEKIKVLENK